MARVTVEDCVEIIPNRFELVVLTAQRSREVSAGAELTRERDDDKNPVVALREIADKSVDPDELQESLLHGLQKHVEADEPEEDDMALLMSGDQWMAGSDDTSAPPPERTPAASPPTGGTEGEMPGGPILPASSEELGAPSAPRDATPSTEPLAPDAFGVPNQANDDTPGSGGA